MKALTFPQRSFVLLVVLILTGAGHLFGRQVIIAWDTPPAAEQVTSWRVWQSGRLIANAYVPEAALTLSAAACEITVTAMNSVGESLHSAPLTIPAETIPPPMLRLVLQKSRDLLTWEDETAVPLIELPMTEPAMFYRLKME